MKVSDITNIYVSHHEEHDKKRNLLTAKIEHRKEQIKRLESRLKKHEKTRLFWIDGIIKPIAAELAKHYPDRTWEVLGPFGLTAETAIHFMRPGENIGDKPDSCLSINFRPENLESGEIGIVDHATDTKTFRPGTIGEINGMNHPEIQIPKNAEIKMNRPMAGKEKKNVSKNELLPCLYRYKRNY